MADWHSSPFVPREVPAGEDPILRLKGSESIQDARRVVAIVYSLL